MINDVFTAQLVLSELLEELHELHAIGEINTVEEVLTYVGEKEQEAERKASDLLEDMYREQRGRYAP